MRTLSIHGSGSIRFLATCTSAVALVAVLSSPLAAFQSIEFHKNPAKPGERVILKRIAGSSVDVTVRVDGALAQSTTIENEETVRRQETVLASPNGVTALWEIQYLEDSRYGILAEEDERTVWMTYPMYYVAVLPDRTLLGAKSLPIDVKYAQLLAVSPLQYIGFVLFQGHPFQNQLSLLEQRAVARDSAGLDYLTPFWDAFPRRPIKPGESFEISSEKAQHLIQPRSMYLISMLCQYRDVEKREDSRELARFDVTLHMRERLNEPVEQVTEATMTGELWIETKTSRPAELRLKGDVNVKGLGSPSDMSIEVTGKGKSWLSLEWNRETDLAPSIPR